MIISSFIGSVFTLFAVVVLMKNLIYLRYGKKGYGRVVAIERYRNQSRHKGRTSSRIYYRPIIEFDYHGESFMISGSGEAIIRYAIGEKIELYSLNDGPEFSLIKDGRHYIFGYLFLLFGFGGIAVASLSSLIECLLPPALLVIGLFIGINYMKAKGKFKTLRDALLKTKLTNRELLEDGDVLWSMGEVDNIRSKHHRSGVVVSLIFFSISSYAAYYCWGHITESGQQSFLAVLQLQAQVESLRPYIEEQAFVAFLIATLFSIISILGVLFTPSNK